VNAHGASAKLADFSDREYEKYFLFDIVHFGWTGWIDVEQAIYEFAKGGA
jgi:D-alanine transfer protein